MAAAVRWALLPRLIAYVMGSRPSCTWLQGWRAGVEGFSPTHTFVIVAAEALNAVWMTSLVVVAWRMPKSTQV